MDISFEVERKVSDMRSVDTRVSDEEQSDTLEILEGRPGMDDCVVCPVFVLDTMASLDRFCEQDDERHDGLGHFLLEVLADWKREAGRVSICRLYERVVRACVQLEADFGVSFGFWEGSLRRDRSFCCRVGEDSRAAVRHMWNLMISRRDRSWMKAWALTHAMDALIFDHRDTCGVDSYDAPGFAAWQSMACSVTCGIVAFLLVGDQLRRWDVVSAGRDLLFDWDRMLTCRAWREFYGGAAAARGTEWPCDM